MRTFVIAVLTALLVAVPASSAQAVVSSSTYEKQILERTNVVRADEDRAALTVKSCLDGYAESWAKHLATKKKNLTHRSTSSLKTIMKKCKLDAIGENLAFGYSTGTATVDAWVKSPGHNANQLRSGHRQIGIGAYRDSKDRYYAVALYGDPR